MYVTLKKKDSGGGGDAINLHIKYYVEASI